MQSGGTARLLRDLTRGGSEVRTGKLCTRLSKGQNDPRHFRGCRGREEVGMGPPGKAIGAAIGMAERKFPPGRG